jgi:hypothetical protein
MNDQERLTRRIKASSRVQGLDPQFPKPEKTTGGGKKVGGRIGKKKLSNPESNRGHSRIAEETL